MRRRLPPKKMDAVGGGARKTNSNENAVVAGSKNLPGGYVVSYKMAPPPAKTSQVPTILPPPNKGTPNSPSRARLIRPGMLRSNSLEPVRPDPGGTVAVRRKIATNPFKQQNTAQRPRGSFEGSGFKDVGGAKRIGSVKPRTGFGGDSLW